MQRYPKKRLRPIKATDLPKPPPAKRGRKKPVVLLTPDEQLAAIDKDIARIELEIKKQTARFEIIRAEMMTGIVSHNGVTAKSASDQLTTILSKLQQERQRALLDSDRYAIEKVISNQKQPPPSKTVEEIHGFCKNGCDPNDLRAGSDYVDVCVKCHRTYDHRLDNGVGNTSFSDYHPGEGVGRVGGYKPPNHFAEIVSQFQGKRRACAPIEVVNKIEKMCIRYKIAKHKITPDIVRMFLKQMQQEQATIRKYSRKTVSDHYKKYTDYYKHCPEIAHRLSGIPPPWMTPMQEDRVAALFLQVVQGYKTSPRYLIRKKDRKNRKTRDEPNNMNYLYVFYKLCQLLGYECFLPYIPLPKSLNNIDDNDENGWKHICNLYGWAYTPTR